MDIAKNHTWRNITNLLRPSTFSASTSFLSVKKVCIDRSKGPWIYQSPLLLQKDKSRTAITLLSFLPFVCLPPRFFLSTYQSSNYFFPLPPLIFTARPRSTPFFPTIFGVISSRLTIFPSSSYVRANVSSAWSRSSPPFILLKNVIYRRISRHRFHKGGGDGLTLCMQASQNRSSKCAGTKLLLILILSFLSRRSSDIRENLLGHIPDELTSSMKREHI